MSEGVFADEAVSTEELMSDGNVDTSQADQSAAPEPGDGKTAEGDQPKFDETKDGKPDEKTDETRTPVDGQDGEKKDPEPEGGQPDKGKPPEGYVEVQALKETRSKLKNATAERDQLKAERDSLLLELEQRMQTDGAGEKEDEFKELTPHELNQLKEEDPDAYYDYRFNLQEHQAKVRQKSEQQTRLKFIEQENMKPVISASEAVNEMLSADGVVDALLDHGIKSGFSQADLVALSQPQTKIVTGDGQVRYLGAGAVAFLKHLDSSRSNDMATIRADVEKELTPKLTEQITKELLGKIKTNTGQTSLDGQGDKGIDKRFPDNMTEAEIAKLTPAEREAWLKQE